MLVKTRRVATDDGFPSSRRHKAAREAGDSVEVHICLTCTSFVTFCRKHLEVVESGAAPGRHNITVN